MAVIYDDPTVAYDTALVTYDGDAGAGTMTGAMTETSTMTATITY